jgi:NADPH:quinone reductase-like Zn-dependent oxidoreductase
MKAIVYTQYGPPDVLELTDIARPIPNDDELLIQIYSSTVNRTDCAQLRAKPFIMRFFTGLFKPKRKILGTAFSGKIEAIGKSVNNFKVGDKVFGFDDAGLSAYAEYLVISADKAIALIPDNVTYQQAAACTEGAHYANNFINKVNLKSGQSVLVNGATGAIGSAAVQLLKYYNLNTVAVANTKNLDLVKSLGANTVIDYTKDDFTKIDQQFDFVFDAVGKSTFAKCKPLLKSGGVYISSEPGFMAQNIFFALTTPFLSNKKVKFPIPVDIHGSVAFIKTLLEQKNYMPVIDKQYELSKIADAYRYVETGEKTGNVVINIIPPNNL